MAEESLVEVVNALGEPSVQGVDAIVQGVDPGSVRTLPGRSPQEEKGGSGPFAGAERSGALVGG